MSPERSPSTSRRFVLQTVATTGLLGIAGCQVRSEPAHWTELDLRGDTTYTDDPNWRMLGHDTGNTFHNPHADGPSDDPSVQWTLNDSTGEETSGHPRRHPLIVDGTVYTTIERAETSDTSENEHRTFVAVDPDTGEFEPIFEAEHRIWRPTIVDDTVYAAVGTSVRAYDLADGTERWRSDKLSSGLSSVRRVGDAIVVLSDTELYDYSDGDFEPLPQLYVLDAESGDVRWDSAGASGGNEPRLPLITDSGVLYPNAASFRDLRSGEPGAELSTPVNYPVLRDGEYYGSDDGGLVSYDWETMENRWEYRPDDRSIGGGWASVVGSVVVIDDFRGPGFVGLDRDTGERLWATEIWDDSFGAIFWASDEDTVYTAHDGGMTAALDITDGSVKWRLNTDEMEWGLGSGCALADDLWLTVGRDGTLFAIS
ncbi:outer membrane protein assembly factor BamB family protein [Natrialba hulunbeirensis]|uniref:outer membrane protein assembly factor BamB family protein n=1 Tax=Natrialba hulunbeirensis TaxID=123783 RepID=UPI001F4D261F|nr:PQQ-binding-like beta-propeller repeat protein [Natrialba hulunbeirensis]